MTTSDFLVFVSYTKVDRAAAERIYDILVLQGFDVWLDSKKIKGGQNWDFEINRALDRASVIIVLLSKSSIDHRGYVQRELKLALHKYEEKLVDDIYIIPLLLDDEVKIPNQLRDIHCLRMSDGDYESHILASLNHQIEKLGGERKDTQESLDVFWSSKIFREEWEGCPGYSVVVEYLEFTSEKYPNISFVGDLIKGDVFGLLFEGRNCKFEQDPEFFSLGQDRWQRTNTIDAYCGDPHVCGSVLTVIYNISYYNGGAAHPSHGFRAYSFVLGPMIYISNLANIFVDQDRALAVLQTRALEILVENSRKSDENGDIGAEIDESWAREGLKDWDCFSFFVFKEQCLQLNFGSYQVAPYVAGTPSAEIPYKDIYSLMRKDYVEALRLPVWDFKDQSNFSEKR